MGVQSAGWSKARAVTQNSKLWPRRTFFPSAGEGESRRCDQLCCGTAANCHCRRKVRNYTLESWNGWKEGRKEGRKEGNLDSARYFGGLHSYSIYFSRPPFLLPTRGTPPLIRSFQTIPRTNKRRIFRGFDLIPCRFLIQLAHLRIQQYIVTISYRKNWRNVSSYEQLTSIPYTFL